MKGAYKRSISRSAGVLFRFAVAQKACGTDFFKVILMAMVIAKCFAGSK